MNRKGIMIAVTFIFVLLIIGSIIVSAETNGDFEYSINNDGTVTITRYIGSESSVIIPSTIDGKSVTSIGDRAFYNRSSLTSIEIPSSVTSIGDGAFEGCSSLTSIEISNSVTSIGSYAFYNCSSLTSMTLPFIGEKADGTGYTYLGYIFGARSYSDNNSYVPNTLKEIIILEGCTSIGYGAFYGCSSITSIEIPSSVTSIGNSALAGCSCLASITVDIKNKKYDSRDNCNAIIETETNTLIAGCKNSIIPSSVTSIGYGAFYNCTSLTSITFEENSSVTSIGEYAFYGCSNITSIEIPSSVTSIGNFAFCECHALTNIEIPYGITTIGDSAFYSCISLTNIEIPNSVTNIGIDAFFYCSKLTRVVLPTNITTISTYMFYGCGYLSEIEIPNTVTSIGQGAFEYCSSLSNIEIPNSVTIIGNYAFANCHTLNNLNIPESVTTIGYEICGGYNVLTSIEVAKNNPNYYSEGNCLIEKSSKKIIQGCSNSVIPNDGSVISIGSGAFCGCVELTDFVIPNNITSIESDAIRDCSNLVSIEIPNSVTSIGYMAFYGCTSLKSVVINDIETWNNINIGDRNDYLLNARTVLHIPRVEAQEDVDGNIEYWYDFENDEYYSDNKCTNEITQRKTIIKRTNISASYTLKFGISSDRTYAYVSGIGQHNGDVVVIPETYQGYPVKAILGRAFYECSGFSKVEIPESVTTIGDSAFYGCSNLVDVYMPDSLESIGDYAFYGCSNLKLIEIPENISSIGAQAFEYCYNLSRIRVEKENTTYHSYKNCIIETSTRKLIAGCSTSIIPNDGSVTNINSYAFAGSSIKSLVIPNSVSSIGQYAFYGCDNLTDIVLSNSITCIDFNTFYGCISLKGIEIPNSVTSIGEGAFSGCISLTTIIIPNSVTNISSGAFSYCININNLEVEIGNSKYHSVDNCIIDTQNKVLVLGCNYSIIPSDGSVTNIGVSAFSYCIGLTTIEIPTSITSIGDSAFFECTGLTTIEIPETITSFGNGAFERCYNLESVYINNLESWCNITFSSSTATPLSYGGNLYLNNELLEDVIFPNTINTINNYTFLGCESDMISPK